MNDKMAVYFSDDIMHVSNKMGISVLHFAHDKVVCVVNEKHAGKNIKEFYPFLTNTKIVANLTQAQALGAERLLMGLAPQGGLANAVLLAKMQQALDLNMGVLHGFHETTELCALEQQANGLIKNLRLPEDKYLVKSFDKARNLNNLRVLMIGTDMAVGKMTAALLLNKVAQARGIDSKFLATGQVGIAISGFGVPLDAIKLDFTGGAIETLVMDNQAPLVFVEGQGSILNPGSSATLPLIRGSAPTHFVLCHNASLTSLKDYKHITFPDFNDLIDLYESIAACCGTFPRPQTAGICVNTSRLTEEQARQYMQNLASSTGKVVLDPVRDHAKLVQILDKIVN